MATTSRSARYAKWLSIPLGLAISALLIWQASYAAFSDNKTLTAHAGAATVEIKLDGHTRMAAFDALNLIPGQSATHTVTAEYAGTVPANVSFYAAVPPENDALAEHLNLELVATVPADSFGTTSGGTYSLHNGPLSEFIRDHGQGNPMSGTAVPDDSATIKVTITLSPSAPNDMQGETVDVVFVGTAQNQ